MQENPKHSLEVKAIFTDEGINFESSHTDINGNLIKDTLTEIINFKEKKTKEALLKLGYVPPEDAKKILNSLEACISFLKNVHPDKDFLYAENILNEWKEWK